MRPLSNVQLEILKTFRHNLNEEDLLKFRQLLVKFFADIAMDEADQVWQKENWTPEKVENLLKGSSSAE